LTSWRHIIGCSWLADSRRTGGKALKPRSTTLKAGDRFLAGGLGIVIVPRHRFTEGNETGKS